MSDWHRVAFPSQLNRVGNVFRCPSRSRFTGYAFTHPVTLTVGADGGMVILRFPATWVFRLEHRRKDPVRLAAVEFVDEFQSPVWESLAGAPFLEVIDPDLLAPVLVVPLEDLIHE